MCYTNLLHTSHPHNLGDLEPEGKHKRDSTQQQGVLQLHEYLKHIPPKPESHLHNIGSRKSHTQLRPQQHTHTHTHTHTIPQVLQGPRDQWRRGGVSTHSSRLSVNLLRTVGQSRHFIKHPRTVAVFKHHNTLHYTHTHTHTHTKTYTHTYTHTQLMISKLNYCLKEKVKLTSISFPSPPTPLRLMPPPPSQTCVVA